MTNVGHNLFVQISFNMIMYIKKKSRLYLRKFVKFWKCFWNFEESIGTNFLFYCRKQIKGKTMVYFIFLKFFFGGLEKYILKRDKWCFCFVSKNTTSKRKNKNKNKFTSVGSKLSNNWRSYERLQLHLPWTEYTTSNFSWTIYKMHLT